ncbi:MULTISPECIES: hypothetical protein [Micromonospora]|uniref:Uncharacterized protein n=1 Tax=Micromonospora rifamycinica TaxID=291594 RepID=A0A120F825_9ACTN|nr:MULTISPECIES: hypothetical protein [Micromonospora]KWV31142.1 hypothetical protein AWV63_19180 [Micromonospora rifamycinica]WFE63644.1 hypothetical protein O7625_10270 [Micromonospora sp. WMMD714]SCG66139.1 hypothetical protein GA0070623_3178 [Micromonospora rifamycinica]
MAKRKARQQTRTITQERPEQDAERAPDWADEAAQARTPEDPRAVAPRDAGGRPSDGPQF